MGLLEDLQQREAELTAFLVNPSRSTSLEAGFGGKFLRDVQQRLARQELAVLTNQLDFQEELFIAKETAFQPTFQEESFIVTDTATLPKDNTLRNALIVVGALFLIG